jgi:3-oxoacyl-[acyl-carrier-protein] synthase III
MQDGYRTVIESLGVYLPPKEVTTKEILRACKQKIFLPLQRLTGIKSRRMAGDEEFAIDLAQRAISECLARSKYSPEDIDLVVCCNISRYDGPDFEFSFEPSTSVRLQRHFGFKNALAFDISNACAGMFTGINIADGYIKAGLIQRALVVSGEYITHLTLTAQKEIAGRNDDRFACLTLGDSGAAVLLERSENPNVGFHAVDMYTLGAFSDYCIARPTHEKHGGAIMFTESVKLHTVAIAESVKHFGHLLMGMKWPREAFNYVIMHQTARTAIQQTATMINKVFKDKICDTKTNMINNLERRGNTSTTTHFVALWDNIINERIQPGDNVVFAIQASGITIGTAPYTFDEFPLRMRRFEKAAAEGKRMPAQLPAASHAAPALRSRHRRVRIESVGTIPEGTVVAADAIELVRAAAENCFASSAHRREEIDLLIHSGVHRNDFICEPAIAAMIAGRLGVNGEGTAADGPKTFAYDVFNGAVGFLNACYNGIAMIRSRKFRNVMVVASEIENNASLDKELLGVKETGSAIILDESSNDVGFGNFIFRYFTDYIDSFRSQIGQEGGTSYLKFMRNPEIENQYLRCIADAVRDLLKREGLSFDQIKAIFPPQISSEFIAHLSERLEVVKSKFVDVAQEGVDLFTSSLPYTLKSAQERKLVGSGDIGLIINVGSGIQVGCAIYYF